MRTVGNYVLALGLVMALAAAGFVILASLPGSSAATCQIGGAFCERPFLLFVPVLTTVALGLLLKLSD
jgi:hypothetical protein